MFQDFLVKTFPEPQDAMRVLIVIVALVLALGTWFGGKRFGWPVTIAAVLFVGLVAAIWIPSALPARPWAYKNTCFHFLKWIQETRTAWSQTNSTTQTGNPTIETLFPNGSHRPYCPRGGVYSWSPEGVPICSHSNLGHRLNP